ncbi:glycosyl transferase [Clavibacter michiganensis]|nr:glycosyltransferase family 9 protein [Clavibacter michiganensis]PPF61852.1 glycosyl transferase [Clavibacter michiganensis]
MTRRALVARLDSVGDVLLSGPAVRALADSPDIDEVWFLCSSIGAEAARLLPGVDRVLVWDCPWITASAPPLSADLLHDLDRLVAECRPDVAVILTSFHQSPLPLALELRMAGVDRIVGASVDYAGPLLDVRLVPGEDFSEDQPEQLRALAIAQAAGFAPAPGDDGGLRIHASAPLPDAVADVISPAGYVVVHPGASASSRRWPAESHRQAVRLLHEAGIEVVVTGGPSEAGLTATVAGTDGVDLGGDTPLPTLAAVLARASVVVTGNTGPAHLAAAVRTPVVSLFSPVVPASRWAPYGVPHILLGDQKAACRGTRATECPVAGHPCLTSITPLQVVEACFELAPGLAQRTRLAEVLS